MIATRTFVHSCTANQRLAYSNQGHSNELPALIGYCDADWGNNLDTRQSVTGYVFILAGGAVSWQSKAQDSVSLSSTQAEYVSACAASRDAMSWRMFLGELNFDMSKPTLIYSDSQSSIAMSKNAAFHQRSKHIDIQHHFVRELVTRRQVEFQFVSTDKMLADVLTKALPRVQHYHLIAGMGIQL